MEGAVMPRGTKHAKSNRNGTGHPANAAMVGVTCDDIREWMEVEGRRPDAGMLVDLNRRVVLGMLDAFDGLPEPDADDTQRCDGYRVALTLLAGGTRFL